MEIEISSEIKNFDQDYKFRARSIFFDRWALWVGELSIGCTVRINTFISATDPPLFLGVDACQDPGEGQF